ncbi:hypothetical protein ACP4OV_011698 [Aristida adscensionis]
MEVSRFIAPAALLLLAMAIAASAQAPSPAPTPASPSAPTPAPTTAPTPASTTASAPAPAPASPSSAPTTVPSPQAASLCPAGFKNLAEFQIGSKVLEAHGVTAAILPPTATIWSFIKGIPNTQVCICVYKSIVYKQEMVCFYINKDVV